MDRNELLSLLRSTFREELAERVDALNHDLLALEQGPSSEEREELFRGLLRTAHNLKGAARAVEAQAMARACHLVEEGLGRLRDEGRPLDPESSRLWLATVDALEDAGERLGREDEGAGPLSEILARLERLYGEDGAAPPRDPASAPARTVEPESRPVAIEERSVDAGGPTARAARVSADRLDALLTRSGELRLARGRLRLWGEGLASARDRLQDRNLGPSLRDSRGDGLRDPDLRALEEELDRLTETFEDEERALGRAVDELDAMVRRARMVSFEEVCRGLERAVHDVAASAGKAVRLELRGRRVELDRSLLDHLAAPLLHLARNAVDHAVETPDERRAAGKDPTARLVVSARLRGSEVEVAVADDGRGIDSRAVAERARELGLPAPESEKEAVDLLFAPGFSTVRDVNEVSGRGIGLDSVRSELERLHGRVKVESEPGVGTTFALTLPLTLTTLRVLLVEAGGQVFAVPGTHVRRLLEVETRSLRSVDGRDVFLWQGEPIPLTPLASVLFPGSPERAAGETLKVVVVSTDHRFWALAVDRMPSEQEILIKPLGPRLQGLDHVGGAALLDDGRIALLLRSTAVIRDARRARSSVRRRVEPSRDETPARILVVDDSLTTRTLQKNALERAGYRVSTAADGLVAWQKIQEEGADVVVADVEMPRMDGFTLTETLRRSPRFGQVPVVLVTSLDNERDRARGLESGADVYLVKSGFEERALLEAVRRLT